MVWCPDVSCSGFKISVCLVFFNIEFFYFPNYTILQNKRMRRCGVAPPPIIFERLKLPQQIIYHRKENLSESLNHLKYWKNILISRFYNRFIVKNIKHL